jgi:response regulator RpfG family c-di-GMP phosphodiesterase
MSSAPQSDDPSPAASAEGREVHPGLAEVLRARGGPLLDALDAHHPPARERADAAASYAFAAAVELSLSRADAEVAREAARLRDVGGVYVAAEALAKPAAERSAEEEAQVARRHELGAQLALGAGLPEQACEWIRLGAERFDGSGPNGLGGEDIPLEARIARGAHACFEALAGGPGDAAEEDRPDPQEALRGAAGQELDPRVVEALLAVLGRAGQ